MTSLDQDVFKETTRMMLKQTTLVLVLIHLQQHFLKSLNDVYMICSYHPIFILYGMKNFLDCYTLFHESILVQLMNCVKL